MVELASRTSAAIAALLLGWTATVVTLHPSRAQPPKPDSQIDFNIPAQSLSRALVAYSAATGLEIYYDASLAEQKNSSEVVGRLMPSDALHILLRSTGYAARATAPGALTIVPAPGEEPASPPTVASRKQLEPYFAALQAGISEALCRNSELSSARGELLVQFWLAPSGVVASADIIDDKGQRTDNQAPALAIRGLALVPPPSGMPQPVNMVIFPSSDASRNCGAAAPQRRAG